MQEKREREGVSYTRHEPQPSSVFTHLRVLRAELDGVRARVAQPLHLRLLPCRSGNGLELARTRLVPLLHVRHLPHQCLATATTTKSNNNEVSLCKDGSTVDQLT